VSCVIITKNAPNRAGNEVWEHTHRQGHSHSKIGVSKSQNQHQDCNIINPISQWTDKRRVKQSSTSLESNKKEGLNSLLSFISPLTEVCSNAILWGKTNLVIYSKNFGHFIYLILYIYLGGHFRNGERYEECCSSRTRIDIYLCVMSFYNLVACCQAQPGKSAS